MSETPTANVVHSTWPQLRVLHHHLLIMLWLKLTCRWCSAPWKFSRVFLNNVQDVSEVPYTSHIDEWHLKENHDFSMFSYGSQTTSRSFHSMTSVKGYQKMWPGTFSKGFNITKASVAPIFQLRASILCLETGKTSTQTTNFLGVPMLVFRGVLYKN